MERLSKISDRLLKAVDTSIKRYLYDTIDFESRLIVLKGGRGVGKTTLLLQRIKELNLPNASIYISLDNILFASESLLDVVDKLYEKGMRIFGLDEVHKYHNWSIELKNIYDSFPDIKMIVTASSALDIMRGMSDLSRRADVYHLKGLSFREYLMLDLGLHLEPYAYSDIINNHIEIAEKVSNTIDVSTHFKKYMKHGYYPYFKESKLRYHDRLRHVINQVIEVDLPPIFAIDYTSVRQLKKLLSVISRIAPFTPNISKLATQLGIGRNRILEFLDYLESADIIHLLKSAKKSDSTMSKPDKILLNNPNIIHALSLDNPSVGTLRETFAMNALSGTEVVTTPARGDFMVNNSHVIEVGGPNKTFHQIHDMPNALLVKDGILVGREGVIPLWMLGMMY